MAIRYEDGGFTPHPRDVLARGFVLGREPASYAWISARLASLFERGERGLQVDRPPLAATLAKLGVWLFVGVAATSVVAICIGALVVRIYTGAFA
jgi:hypothetical protein